MNHKEAEQMLERIASELGEHFDAVQIMASFNEEGQSIGMRQGVGNWYARVGMAREMVLFDEANIFWKQKQDFQTEE